MISKDEFLSKVKAEIFPLVDVEEEKQVEKKAILVGSIIFIPLFIFVLILIVKHAFEGEESKTDEYLMEFSFLFGAFAYGFILDRYIRRKKKELRPIVYKILKADLISEKQQNRILIKQLRKIYFLPRFDSYRKDEIKNDAFGFSEGKIPFYIQEVSFSERGRNPEEFRGPLVQFFLNKDFEFKLMIMEKKSLLSKDQKMLSMQKAFSGIFKTDDFEPLILESKEFNDTYFAYTNDQIKARTILTPKFMEHIKDIEKVYRAPVNILFYNGQLVLMIKTNRDMFEFFHFGKKLVHYERFYDEVAKLYEFKEFFKLK